VVLLFRVNCGVCVYRACFGGVVSLGAVLGDAFGRFAVWGRGGCGGGGGGFCWFCALCGVSGGWWVLLLCCCGFVFGFVLGRACLLGVFCGFGVIYWGWVVGWVVWRRGVVCVFWGGGLLLFWCVCVVVVGFGCCFSVLGCVGGDRVVLRLLVCCGCGGKQPGVHVWSVWVVGGCVVCLGVVGVLGGEYCVPGRLVCGPFLVGGGVSGVWGVFFCGVCGGCRRT